MSDGEHGYPLIELHPVADPRHAWVGAVLSVVADKPADVAPLFLDLGLAEALDPLPCVVNLADAPDLEAFPPARVVLRCPAHGADLQADLRRRGFRVLVDCPSDGAMPPAGVDALVCGAVAAGGPAPGWVKQRPGPHLALGVDSRAAFDACCAAGFTWLVGDYPLDVAVAAAAGGRSPHHALLLRLLGLVVRDADSRAIEAALKEDVHLSYQLLRLVNSAAMAPPRPITSFADAIALLGRRQLQRWLQLLIYAHPAGQGINPLLPRAALRAQLMEALCAARGGDREARDQAFMVGMFSLLDRLFGQPLAELLPVLRLPAGVEAALLAREGDAGRLLGLVGDRKPAGALGDALANLDVSVAAYDRGLLEAFAWAVRITREF